MFKELKPCPFCGGKAGVREHDFYDFFTYSVVCLDCHVETRQFFGGLSSQPQQWDDAVEQWNMRYQEMKQVSVLDEIRTEFINQYPKNYMGEPEFDGASRVFSLNEVLNVIDTYKQKIDSQK